MNPGVLVEGEIHVSGFQETYLRVVRGQSRGPSGFLCRMALSIASFPYGVVTGARNRFYDRPGTHLHKFERPVISVGNITLGGTGKTPVVEWVARWYRERGLRVCLLSRGYGQSESLNDEGLVLDQNLPDVPHLQDRDRVGIARIAIEELDSEILVLDDGFQHRRLVRDLDIVLLDALDPFGGGKLFPRGLLREPIHSLRRAGVVVLSRSDLVDPSVRNEIRRQAERYAGPLRWVQARQAPQSLMSADGSEEGLEQLSGARVIAFCGLGNPDGFRRTLLDLGVELQDFRTFPDHHVYSRSDVNNLGLWAESQRPALILTTQKDSVKLRLDQVAGIPLRSLRIAFEPLSGLAELESSLAEFVPDRGV